MTEISGGTGVLTISKDDESSSIGYIVKEILQEELSSLINDAMHYLQSVPKDSGLHAACASFDRFLQDVKKGGSGASRVAIQRARERLSKLLIVDPDALGTAMGADQALSGWVLPPAKGTRQLHGALPVTENLALVDKQTPIGTVGCHLMTTLRDRLIADGFNYVMTEDSATACAEWGYYYTTPSFRQLVESCLGVRERPNLLFECEDTGEKELWDPFREGVFFKTINEYYDSTAKHMAAAKEALLKAKVFVLSIGLNEICRVTSNNWAIVRFPRNLAPYLFHKEILSVAQNVQELQGMLDTWRMHNPDIKLILSVSPLPIYATFRADECHSIAANCHSQSVLLLAAKEFALRNPGRVFYLPSFELASYGTAVPLSDDCRLPSDELADKAFDLFKNLFVH